MMAVAVAAMSFAACSTDVTEEIAPVEKFTVKINAAAPETRTVFGTLDDGEYPTLWEGDETIKAALNVSTAKSVNIADVSNDGASATFDEVTFTDDASGSYTIYAVSPASAASGLDTQYKSWTIVVPTEQTPTATSCDPAAQILVGKSATTTSVPSEVTMNFNHFTAYAKINFKNVALNGATVESIHISADGKIAGQFYNYPTQDKANYTNYAKTSITVDTNSLTNVWVALAPTTVKELTFTINTDQGAITKAVTGLEKEFKSGVVATFNVDMTGKTIEKGDKYTLVTDLSVLAEGDNVIIATVDYDYATGKYNGGNYRERVTITKNDNTIVPTSDVGIFTVHDAGTNLYAFKDVNEDQYLYDSSTSGKNYIGIQATNDENGYWDITIKNTTTGAASIVSNGTGKSLQYYHDGSTAGNCRFSCYSSVQKDVVLYYKSNGGAKIAIDPQIIPAKTAIEIAATDTYAEVGLTLRGITGNVDIDWDAEWIDDAEVTDNTLYLTILENTTSEAREGSITISGGGASATITISQLGAVAGATVYTLTNEEISSYLASNNTGSYGDVSISSASGTWVGKIFKKNQTFLQIRNKEMSRIETPTFNESIKSISFKINSTQSKNRNIYVVPTDATFPSGSTEYSNSNVFKNSYGSTSTNTGANTVVVNLSDTTQKKVIIVVDGATYIDEISVTCAD